MRQGSVLPAKSIDYSEVRSSEPPNPASAADDVYTPPSDPVRRRDTVAFAAHALRSMIVSRALAPGTPLSQARLAREIGVSTTPLREAMRQLEAEGLVESRHNQRSRIPPFDPDDLETVYSSRVLLESLAVTLAVPAMKAGQLSVLREHLDAMKAAATTRDIVAWHAAHGAFHTNLMVACSAPLRHQVATLAARCDRYRLMSVLSEQPASWAIGDADHAGIVEACEARDPDLASTRLAQHLARSALILMAHMAPEIDPAGIRVALRMATARAGPG
jgi:DNA-binding GntR family transcriptional regulator